MSWNRIRTLSFSSCLLLNVLAIAPALNAQADGAPQYSDSDKRKMAEIEQKPEVKASIQKHWDDKRREDLQFIYRLNINDRRSSANDRDQHYATDIENTGALYNNPMLQRYLNEIGQRLVPKDSPNLYSFKLVLNPVPFTHAYTTGTILVSTGMVSILDNEAQLAYVLGREIAHVEKDHAFTLIRNEVVQHELNAEKEQQKASMVKLFGGLIGGLLAMNIHMDGTEWPVYFEDDADAAALQYMMNQAYDARETPHVFEHLETITTRDPRVGLGNGGNVVHLRARRLHLQELLSGDLKTQIQAKLQGASLTGSSGEFAVIMAALKRDNGIIAFNYDLFAISRENLEDAVNLRSNDARAQLYLGKVISVTARNDADRQEAEQHFLKAIQCDDQRGAYPDPHLEHAIHLIANNSDKDEIAKEIEAYIALYQREHDGRVPENMPILYDYLNLAGENTWYAAPTTVISTKNVEALRVNTSGRTEASSAAEIVRKATATAPPASTPANSSAPDPSTVVKAKAGVRKGAAK
jgi:Zn-dependent protease with chaperone function